MKLTSSVVQTYLTSKLWYGPGESTSSARCHPNLLSIIRYTHDRGRIAVYRRQLLLVSDITLLFCDLFLGVMNNMTGFFFF